MVTYGIENSESEDGLDLIWNNYADEEVIRKEDERWDNEISANLTDRKIKEYDQDKTFEIKQMFLFRDTYNWIFGCTLLMLFGLIVTNAYQSLFLNTDTECMVSIFNDILNEHCMYSFVGSILYLIIMCSYNDSYMMKHQCMKI